MILINKMKFSQLSEILQRTHEGLANSAVRAVNIGLTLRNYLFGFYILEFEQNGEDRAKYRSKLLQVLADKLSVKGLSAPELSRCRQFYKSYPEILRLILVETDVFEVNILLTDIHPLKMFGTLSQTFPLANTKAIFGTMSQKNEVGSDAYDMEHIKRIVTLIPYSHFSELIKIESVTKRLFYELLILKTTPSVRELRRQIESLSFERLGLSVDKDHAFDLLQRKIIPAAGNDMVKSHYFFDFLKIPQLHLLEESELEQALIDHLQDFILELGFGFCFEARQKRILIDDEYYFIDLVFYHRILKCHVLIELKTEHARHEHIGQLKVYLQHYKYNEMAEDDNPPVGILLVTDKKKTLVEYAVAESDKELFVSKYQLELPDKKALESFIRNELRKL